MFAFAPNNQAQLTMDPQLDLSLELNNQPFSQTTIPFTPELSDISTPDSNQSATFQQLRQNFEATEPETPATTVSTTGQANGKNMGTMASQFNASQEGQFSNVLANVFDTGMSKKLTSNNSNWLLEFSAQAAQLRQPVAFSAYSNQYPNGYNMFTSANGSPFRPSVTGYGQSMYSQQPAVRQTPTTANAKNEVYPNNDFGPVLTVEDFPPPPFLDNTSFADYGNSGTFVNDNTNNGYMQSQVSTSSFPVNSFSQTGTGPTSVNSFDFNDMASTNASLNLDIATSSGALPVNSNPMPTTKMVGATTPVVQQSTQARQNAKDAKLDEKLLAWRSAGLTYKQIKEQGNFGLEESTLRGRYRTLTKAREQRLRKPDWPAHAVSRSPFSSLFVHS